MLNNLMTESRSFNSYNLIADVAEEDSPTFFGAGCFFYINVAVVCSSISFCRLSIGFSDNVAITSLSCGLSMRVIHSDYDRLTAIFAGEYAIYSTGCAACYFSIARDGYMRILKNAVRAAIGTKYSVIFGMPVVGGCKNFGISFGSLGCGIVAGYNPAAFLVAGCGSFGYCVIGKRCVNKIITSKIMADRAIVGNNNGIIFAIVIGIKLGHGVNNIVLSFNNINYNLVANIAVIDFETVAIRAAVSCESVNSRRSRANCCTDHIYQVGVSRAAA